MYFGVFFLSLLNPIELNWEVNYNGNPFACPSHSQSPDFFCRVGGLSLEQKAQGWLPPAGCWGAGGGLEQKVHKRPFLLQVAAELLFSISTRITFCFKVD